ncbi:MAG: amidohydrolase [Desulfurococcales archaeon]|nr:amidohydrolase [Desulfurococcales archaeon]
MVYTGISVLDYNGDELGDSVYVEKGVIAGVGPASRFLGVRRVEVDGYIMPGLVDAHMHLEGLGMKAYTVDLRGSRSAREVAKRLAGAQGPIALGRGWDQEYFEEPGLPSRKLLDEALGDKPGVAVRVCGHMAVANTAALSLARPWERFPGLVDRERGVLVEDAVYYTLEKLKAWMDPIDLVSRALGELRSYGVYGASSMACGAREIEALEKLEAKGPLGVRVACYASSEDLLGLSGREWRVVGLKLFADGSLGARTARLREDYSDSPGTRGLLLLDSERIAERGERLLRAGFRLAVHAIGDEALDNVVEAYRRLGGGGRLRVEHASVAWDEQVEALAELGVWVVAQPHFKVSDWWIEKRLGGRARLAYRLRSMRLAGVRLAFSTDAPVEPLDPVETLRAAVGLCNEPACRAEESLRPREALEAYTLNAALASGGPVRALGAIEKGRPAFLAVSTEDPRGLSGLERARVRGLV